MPRRDGPLRTCIVTRQEHAPDALIRFVLSPAGMVVPDIRGKLPGRGVWVTGSAAIVRQAVKRRSFERGFKLAAKGAKGPKPAEKAESDLPAQIVGGDIAAEVGRLLEIDCLASLSMVNKAGLVVAGFGKVEDEIASGVAGVIHASDGKEDGKRKLSQAVFRRYGASGPQIVDLFESAQLDLALGRSNVIHAALKQGAASKAFLARCRRLAAYRAERQDDTGGPMPAQQNPGTND